LTISNHLSHDCSYTKR